MPKTNVKKSSKKHNKKHNKKKLNKSKKTKRNYNSSSSSRRHKTHKQRGGFSNCSLATVKEPGFSIPAIGDIPGFNLSQSKGVIHRPNCKSDSYHAMTPL